jgi:hypothetical protein
MTPAHTPHITSTAHRAAKHLHKTGTLSRADLFAQVHFGAKRSNREQMLDSAIANGWLIESRAGVAISPMLRAHFDSLEAPKPVKFIGSTAGPRDTGSAYDRPQLSRKFIPNARGFRDDVPEFSVRQSQSFRSVPTGGGGKS